MTLGPSPPDLLQLADCLYSELGLPTQDLCRALMVAHSKVTWWSGSVHEADLLALIVHQELAHLVHAIHELVIDVAIDQDNAHPPHCMLNIFRMNSNLPRDLAGFRNIS